VKPLWEMEEDDWEEVIRTHLKHTFSVTRHACRFWHDEAAAGRPPRGRIVNSVAATGLVGRPDMGSNHAAAKGAIAAFTLAVAHEMFSLGVTVNAVCPAAVRTRMATHLNIEHPESEGGFDPASPANLAPLVTYLCSDRADWVTGQVFRIVGGLLGLYQPWSIVAHAEHEGRWTVEELDVALRRLYGNYPGVVREAVDPYGRSPVASRSTGPHPMAFVRR
jgi:NAD(P)-dependent dehydrogenase (short-subunit alcohol dehydrogenase family)